MSSRHFHHHDLKKSLNGIVTLKEEAVPSKFPSFEDSAKKRKPPTLRESPPTKVVKTAHALELKTSSSMTQTTCDAENVVGLAEDDEAIKERLTQLETELRTTLEAKEKLEQENAQLQTNMSALHYKKKLAESRVFTLGHFTSDEDISLYTGFPNYQTFKAVFDFLNPGLKGENIRYFLAPQEKEVSLMICMRTITVVGTKLMILWTKVR